MDDNIRTALREHLDEVLTNFTTRGISESWHKAALDLAPMDSFYSAMLRDHRPASDRWIASSYKPVADNLPLSGLWRVFHHWPVFDRWPMFDSWPVFDHWPMFDNLPLANYWRAFVGLPVSEHLPLSDHQPVFENWFIQEVLNAVEGPWSFYNESMPVETVADPSIWVSLAEKLVAACEFTTFYILPALLVLSFLSFLFHLVFFYDNKEGVRQYQNMSVRTVEKGILMSDQKEREKVKQRLLKAIERIDITKQPEKEMVPFPVEWLAMTFQPACKAWGERVGAKIKVQWRTVVEEVTRLADEMGLFEISAGAANENNAVEKSKTPRDKAEEANWEIVSNEEEKSHVADLTEKEWMIVKEFREKNGKDTKNGWFFKQNESDVAQLSKAEWKIVKEAREQQKKKEKRFLVEEILLGTLGLIYVVLLIGVCFTFWSRK
ncbi:hypothetical protein L207DRAFT_510566 [Hyaloscypha variabilis F]|uniref:Uncharacterized protein n=1 Tax=Hyaloscypha variabilis (strain UAMH 11265 / GT02V1 / F) TaxID=1149755 RepID=A0A2J6RV16_HYAVF|nr:hypothetical protein L207DRAFT_510566 [Hyaloscypha variabilis F]